MGSTLFKLEDIAQLDALQIRDRIDPDTVADYAAIYLEDINGLPPVEVFLVQGKGAVLVDGWHRYAASIRAGKTKIKADTVGTGRVKDALAYALQCNRTHGLRRSNADKRRAVLLALEHDVQGARKLTTRELADLCGVSHRFAGQIVGETAKPASGPETVSRLNQSTNEANDQESLSLPGEPEPSRPSAPPVEKRDPRAALRAEYKALAGIHRRVRSCYQDLANLEGDEDGAVRKLYSALKSLDGRVAALESKIKR